MSAFGLVTCAELFPSELSPSAVRTFTPPAEVVTDGARGAFTLIVPRGSYTNLLDTYQVSMNVPVVHLSYLAREDPRTAAMRSKRFPALYPNPRELSARLLAQMKDAGVHYVPFEDRQQYDSSRFRGEPVAEQKGAVLVRYYPPLDEVGAK